MVCALIYFSPVGRHFPELPESEATNSYGGLRTFASLGPFLWYFLYLCWDRPNYVCSSLHLALVLAALRLK